MLSQPIHGVTYLYSEGDMYALVEVVEEASDEHYWRYDLRVKQILKDRGQHLKLDEVFRVSELKTGGFGCWHLREVAECAHLFPQLVVRDRASAS